MWNVKYIRLKQGKKTAKASVMSVKGEFEMGATRVIRLRFRGLIQGLIHFT